jgi:hypothetical protein
VVIEDLFGQGADQGLAAQRATMELLGVADDLVEVEGAFGLFQYIYDYIYIGLSLGGTFGAAAGSAAGQAQGAELGVSGCFQDFEEFLASEGMWVCVGSHKGVDKLRDIMYMSITNYTIYEPVSPR